MAEKEYRIPDLERLQLHQGEITIKRSRFIASIGRVRDTEEAKEFIALISIRNRDASHNCYGYNAGPPGSTAFVGMSDDGEPHGTAGQPILSMILRSGIGEMAVVVTRYFGGILLGTGGLVRAYQDCVEHGLSGLPTRLLQEQSTLRLILEHRHVGIFMHLRDKYTVTCLESGLGERASFRISIASALRQDFLAELTDLTRGRACISEETPGRAP